MSLQVETVAARLPPKVVVEFYKAVDPKGLFTQVLGWPEPLEAAGFLIIRVPKAEGNFNHAVDLVKTLGFHYRQANWPIWKTFKGFPAKAAFDYDHWYVITT